MPSGFQRLSCKQHCWRHQQYSCLKQNWHHRDTWLGQLVQAQAQVRGCKNGYLEATLLSKYVWQLDRWNMPLGKWPITRHWLLWMPRIQSQNIKGSAKKMDLVKACLEEAYWQFKQAQETPFLTTLLVDIFGETGSPSKAFNKVLKVTFALPPACDWYVGKVLEKLAQPTMVQAINPQALHDYVWGWSWSHEKMSSSSPSTLQFGHYMAGVQDMVIMQLNAVLVGNPSTDWLFSSPLVERT